MKILCKIFGHKFNVDKHIADICASWVNRSYKKITSVCKRCGLEVDICDLSIAIDGKDGNGAMGGKGGSATVVGRGIAIGGKGGDSKPQP